MCDPTCPDELVWLLFGSLVAVILIFVVMSVAVGGLAILMVKGHLPRSRLVQADMMFVLMATVVGGLAWIISLFADHRTDPWYWWLISPLIAGGVAAFVGYLRKQRYDAPNT